MQADDGALPGLERSGLVRSVQTPEFEGITFHEVLAKSALNAMPEGSGLPFRFTVNTFRGCSHACRYCFARPTHEYLDLDAWPTAPAQGALAIEVRRGEEHLVRAIDHTPTRAAAEAERGVLARLEAGCSAPVGAHALIEDELLFLSARVYSHDGTTVLTASHAAAWPDRDAPAELAVRAGDELLAAGAAALTTATTTPEA